MTFELPARDHAPRRPGRAACVALTVLVLGAAAAPARSEPLVYPARSQGAEQQDRDRYECHGWARRQSGHDPARPAAPGAAPTAAPATPGSTITTSTPGSPAHGMAVGAIGAAAVAELTNHDAGRAAAVGALGGGIAQHARQQQARQAAAQQQQAARDAPRATYERAMAACLEGRGYIVK